MGIKVELADDVMEELQRHAVPLKDDVNSVLRRILKQYSREGDSTARDTDAKTGGDTGYLRPYIESGKIAAGTPLIWERPRVGQVLRATVTESGHLVVDGDTTLHKSPSGAACAAADVDAVDGWTQAWTLPDGKLLDTIRHE